MTSTDLWVLLTQTRTTLESIGDRLRVAIGYLPSDTGKEDLTGLIAESEQLLHTMLLVIREVDDAYAKKTIFPGEKRASGSV